VERKEVTEIAIVSIYHHVLMGFLPLTTDIKPTQIDTAIPISPNASFGISFLQKRTKIQPVKVVYEKRCIMS